MHVIEVSKCSGNVNSKSRSIVEPKYLIIKLAVHIDIFILWFDHNNNECLIIIIDQPTTPYKKTPSISHCRYKAIQKVEENISLRINRKWTLITPTTKPMSAHKLGTI